MLHIEGSVCIHRRSMSCPKVFRTTSLGWHSNQNDSAKSQLVAKIPSNQSRWFLSLSSHRLWKIPISPLSVCYHQRGSIGRPVGSFFLKRFPVRVCQLAKVDRSIRRHHRAQQFASQRCPVPANQGRSNSALTRSLNLNSSLNLNPNLNPLRGSSFYRIQVLRSDLRWGRGFSLP